ECIFRAALADIEPVGKVHQKNRPQHNNHDACSSKSKQHATQHSQTSSQLGQPDQISHDNWPVMRCSKLLRARASKAPEEDGASMIEKRHSARRSNSAVLILAGNVSLFSMPRSMPEKEPWTQARLFSGRPGEPSITFGRPQ